jgi:probable DNA repair protein
MQEILEPDATWATLDELAAMPAAATLVLTVNNRLARRLTQDLALRLRAERQVSELPRILPLSAWLMQSGDELAFDPAAEVPPHRLDGFAAQQLWMDVIREEEADRVLLDVAQAARLAQDADQLMDEWELAVPSSAETDEYRGFARWRRRYRQRLAQLGAEDLNTMYARVLAAALRESAAAAATAAVRPPAAAALAFPRTLVLAGFTEISPRFKQLLDAFDGAGTAVRRLRDAQREPAAVHRLAAMDRGAEWRAAAQWAREHLDSNPQGRYAIVSTELESEAPFVRRVLGQVLGDPPRAGFDAAASTTASAAPLLRHPFNVAVGRPLAEWPAVRAALHWMQALAEFSPFGVVDAAVLGVALLAGHCAGDVQEAGHIAAIDANWRRRGRMRATVNSLAKDFAGSPRLAEAWARAVDTWRQAGGDTTCDSWSTTMKSALLALGFPGERPLDSVSYQVMGAFAGLLDQFAALAPVAGLLDGRAAVDLLRRAAQAESFQPQRDPLARLDVLGLLEAEGGAWDGIWILGLTDEALPSAPKPNPLIPLAVLRQAGAPRATPERERIWAQAIFEALSRGAPEIVASHAYLDGERELRPSPLVAELPATAWRPPAPAAVPLLEFQTLVDEQGPPLASGESGTGGLDLLDTQARNPMWAFVRHRLGGRALEDYADSATMNVRGSFLHRALELLWAMLPTQDDLHRVIEEGRLGGLLQQAVEQAAEDQLQACAPVIRTLECERALAVLAAWLDVEAQRPPFAVREVEREHPWRHGPLALKVRVDRMDALADGRMLIVDYKTGMGQASPEADWSRTRPVNLQLPFYAAVLAEDEDGVDVAGLMLAQIHARQVGALGLGDEDVDIAGVVPASRSKYFGGEAWREILQRWRSAIAALADEYARGHAANASLRLADLKYCDAMPFLRLDRDEEGDAS